MSVIDFFKRKLIYETENSLESHIPESTSALVSVVTMMNLAHWGSSGYVNTYATGYLWTPPPDIPQTKRDWWRCDGCGHAVNWENLSCPHCGAQLPARYDR